MSKKEDTLPAVSNNLPADGSMFESDCGAGFEDANDAECYAIPFLKMLQKGSPQVDEDHPMFASLGIPDAKPGMLVNSVTNKIMPEGVRFLPCYFRRSFIRWGDNQGGYKGEYSPADPLVGQTVRDEKGKDSLGDGTHLEDTRSHYGLIIMPDGMIEPALIAFASTQTKKSRNWMTQLNNLRVKGKNGLITPPMFASLWELSAVTESNDQGSWKGWKIAFDRYLSSDEAHLYQAAKQFKESILMGDASAAHDSVEDPGPF